MIVPETPEQAREYLRARYEFVAAISRTLREGLGSSVGGAVYGVWLTGHLTPIYIGQSTEPRRRLWDLPIGESHHLANSFAPDIWERIVVVSWENVVRDGPDAPFAKVDQELDKLRQQRPTSTSRADPSRVVGLAFEYLLQCEYLPVFNEGRKLRDGTRRIVQPARSRSIGALVAPKVADSFEAVHDLWKRAAALPSRGQALVGVGDHAFVAFPPVIRSSIGSRHA